MTKEEIDTIRARCEARKRMSRQQNSLMSFDPATGSEKPYPSRAQQWRMYHGKTAWIFNPWTGERRVAEDVGSDTFGLLIIPPDEPVYADSDWREKVCAAEARAKEAERRLSIAESNLLGFAERESEAKARTEQGEAERDALIAAFSAEAEIAMPCESQKWQCPFADSPVCGEQQAEDCWLAWARRTAKRGKKDFNR